MRTKAPVIGAVEIGTATIKIIVGTHKGRQLSILSHAECPSRGVSKGTVIDFAAASECTHQALQAAEHRAGVSVDYVFLAQTGDHLAGCLNEATVNVQAGSQRVAKSDIAAVCALATAKELPPDRMVLHHLRGPFRVDGRVVPGNPVRHVGRRLEVGCWIMHGQQCKLAESIHLLRGSGCAVRELVFAGLASGEVVTTTPERQRGILVLDLGAGTTDYVLYREGRPCITGVLPVGGVHLTYDLALGLRLTEAQAEKLKLRHGRALVSTRHRDKKVWLAGNYTIGDRQVSRQAIEQITSARTREIFEVVKMKLGPDFRPETCAAGVILTGGMSRLRGIVTCATGVFGVPARRGKPPRSVQGGKLRGPGYSTVLGLLRFHHGANHLNNSE